MFRYQEIQSQNLTKQKHSFDQIPDLQLPLSPESATEGAADSPVFFGESNENCGLCDENTSNKALWYCEQCCVAYCQNCLEHYHPKRGQLAHHRLRKPQKLESVDKPAFCMDHSTEVAAIFCDQCQLLVCHLCVCEGVGKHSQHKILSLDTAWNQTKVINPNCPGKRDFPDKHFTSYSSRSGICINQKVLILIYYLHKNIFCGTH